MRGLTITLAAALVATAAGSVAHAETPATPEQSYVLEQAAGYYRAIGYQFPQFTVGVVSDTEAGALMGDVDGPGFLAAADPEHIYLTDGSRDDLQVLARVAAKPTVKARFNAYMACSLRCIDAASTALHETAHLVQFQYNAVSYPPEGAINWTEGVADAVAYDLHARFVRRLIGRAPAGSWWKPQLSYSLPVRAVRLASAAATGTNWTSRASAAWRITQLTVPLAPNQETTP